MHRRRRGHRRIAGGKGTRTSGSIDMGYERAALDPRIIPPHLDGCDAVIMTASTARADPIELAVRLLRDRGRVVVVGDVHVDVPRGPSYEREVDIRFSRSYGPGRYDREYEERGLDYPIGYVRWTEQRNMAAFLDLVASGRVKTDGLILERLPVDDAGDAYERLALANTSPLGMVLEYQTAETRSVTEPSSGNGHRYPTQSPRPHRCDSTINVIGAGSYAQRILIPALRKAGFTLGAVASARGLSAKAAADEFGFARATCAEDALADPDARFVAIATRHSSHAALAEIGLRAGKTVFVEKPPCVNFEELAALRLALTECDQRLHVGFNRRHAPLAIALRDHVRAAEAPIELLYRVNAGSLAPDHWLIDRRMAVAVWWERAAISSILPAGSSVPCQCLSCRSAASSPVTEAWRPRASPSHSTFADGSIATILYLGEGRAISPRSTSRLTPAAGPVASMTIGC